MRWFGWFRKQKKAVPVHPFPSLLREPKVYGKGKSGVDASQLDQLQWQERMHYLDTKGDEHRAQKRREEEERVRRQDDDSSNLLNTVLATEVIESIVDSNPAPDPGPSDSGSFDGGGGGDSGGGGASF